MRGQRKFLKVKTTKTKTLDGETTHISVSGVSLKGKDQVGKDRYTTAAEASERAEAIGCSGSHTHTVDGETIYMPCQSMAEYEGAVGEGYSADSPKSASTVEDVTIPPAKMEDIAMKIAEGTISLGESRPASFMKRCVVSEQGEGTNTRKFSTRMDISAMPSEPIYDGSRIIDYQNVSFKGYASTNEDTTKEDRIGDYLRRGAFRKTIREFKKNPVMLIDHENSVKNIAGSYANMVEDDKGLFVEGRISNAPELATVRTLIAEGHLKTLSIGGMFYYEDDGKAISQVDLMEVSLVAIPMNPDARFEAV